MGFRRAFHSSGALLLTAVVALIGAGTGSASAPPDTNAPGGSGADPGQFAVQPSSPDGPGGRDYFIYTLQDGQLQGDIVAISNLGTEPATFAIYATDAITTKDGSFSLLREEEKPTGVGTWIELGATQYTVDPGKLVNIPFKLSVPADATPGDHVGAIVAQKIEDPDNPDGIGLDVRVRVAARVYVRVDGPVSPSMTIDRFTVTYDAPANPLGEATARVSYTLTNTGDIRLSPAALLKFSGLFGVGERSAPERQIPELLPGSSIQISETVPGVKAFGRLTVDLEVTDPDASLVVKASLTRWAVPWLVLSLLAVVLLAVGFFVWRRRRAA